MKIILLIKFQLIISLCSAQVIPMISQRDTITSEQDSIQSGQDTVTSAKTDTSFDSLSQIKGQVSSLEEFILETKSTVDKSNNIKLSGYFQSQFRTAVRIKPQQNPDGNCIGKYDYPVDNYSS